jgi:GH15 family glucan-1,4-alpha-glucosidase
MSIGERLLDDTYPEIAEYGLIGDLRTSALVGRDGALEFLSWPRFCDPAIFAAHVDRRRGGRFQICPQLTEMRQKKLYLPDTNILLSRFLSEEGIAEVSDFMWCEEGVEHQAVVRRAKAVKGTVRFRVLCLPAFNCGRNPHRIERIDDCQLLFVPEESGSPTMRLQASVALAIEDSAGVAEVVLEAGETAAFVLDEQCGEVEEQSCTADGFVARAFKGTSNYWRGWIGRSQYQGRWREVVNRSALALKLLTAKDYGSMIAAPCFGFPNEIGGERNWDYRFTWVRDSAFSMYALMRLGFTDEAEAFIGWLADRCAETPDGSLEILYEIDGSPMKGEMHLEHFEGYEGSRPVRIGSTNHGQLQLDIYGEVMDSIYLFDKHARRISYDFWRHLRQMVDFVIENWRQPDASIWEVRSEQRHFLYSRVMCWVAIDRAYRLAQKRSLPAPLEKWRKIRDEIYESVFEEFWDEERGAFVQFSGGKAVDAAAFIMPLIRFISPTDPKWLSTLRVIEKDLVTDSLVYRYRVGQAFSDELEGQEGTFSICSLWYVECVARAGDLEKARFLFEKMLSYRSELGLFSEQLGEDGRFLGNVPQAFTHLSLISAAYELDRRLDAR